MLETIVSCSSLRIGPYLFYREKFITQFKMIGYRTRFRENDDFPAAKEKAAIF